VIVQSVNPVRIGRPGSIVACFLGYALFVRTNRVQMSPLFNHLSPGDLITHVDDVFLGEGGDAWVSYLSGSEIGDEGMGWCVDRAVYNGELGVLSMRLHLRICACACDRCLRSAVLLFDVLTNSQRCPPLRVPPRAARSSSNPSRNVSTPRPDASRPTRSCISRHLRARAPAIGGSASTPRTPRRLCGYVWPGRSGGIRARTGRWCSSREIGGRSSMGLWWASWERGLWAALSGGTPCSWSEYEGTRGGTRPAVARCITSLANLLTDPGTCRPSLSRCS
jgi:hypothetical protein